MKCCVEIDNVLNVTIQVITPLLKFIYRTPFCGSTLVIYEFNMHATIEKIRATKEDQNASNIILVEPKRVNWSNLHYVIIEWLISCYWNGGFQVGQRSFQQLNMVFTSCTSSFIHVVKLHFNNSCYRNLTQWSDAPQYIIFITFVTRKHLFWVTHNDEFFNTFIIFVFKKHLFWVTHKDEQLSLLLQLETIVLGCP